MFAAWLSQFSESAFFVISCYANGAALGKGKFFSSKIKTCLSMSEMRLFAHNDTATRIVANFKNKTAALNYEAALKRPLCRFGLVKMQNDQNMKTKCYSLIPNIDWSNPKSKTDIGILEMCGFMNEEASEFAAYCEAFIAKIDAGE